MENRRAFFILRTLQNGKNTKFIAKYSEGIRLSIDVTYKNIKASKETATFAKAQKLNPEASVRLIDYRNDFMQRIK